MNKTIEPNRYFLFASIILAVAFAGINPAPNPTFFGFTLHLIHWLFQAIGLMICLIALQCHLGQTRFAKYFPSPWHQSIAVGFLTPWLFAPLGVVSDVAVAQEPYPVNWFFAYLDEVGGMTLPVVVVWVGLQMPFLLGYEFRASQSEATPEPAGEDSHPNLVTTAQTGQQAAPETTNLHRLLPCAPEQVIAMSSELHYISIMTAQSKHLVLYSLKNAVTDIGVPGLQCHRSHWVNQTAIKALHQKGRQGEIELTNQLRIPVSRGRMDEVKQLCLLKEKA